MCKICYLPAGLVALFQKESNRMYFPPLRLDSLIGESITVESVDQVETKTKKDPFLCVTMVENVTIKFTITGLRAAHSHSSKLGPFVRSTSLESPLFLECIF